MTTIKNVSALLLAAGVAAGLSACAPAGSATPDAEGDAATTCNVGISMPTRSLERWINDGEGSRSMLEADGCTVDLQYADNKTDQQISQIQNQVANGANILVIAAIDGTTLGPVLDTAATAGAKVIAYDRLILGTKNVDYYATFDNYTVGQLQGTYIETTLGLKDGKGPFNLEPFAGSPDDNNAGYFFAGAWDVPEPVRRTSGKLVVPSGKAPATPTRLEGHRHPGLGLRQRPGRDGQPALASFYAGGKKVDVVLSPNDSLAQGISQSLQTRRLHGSRLPGPHGPGWRQGLRQEHPDGVQSMTVWKDTRLLGQRVEMMISPSWPATRWRSTTPRRTTTASRLFLRTSSLPRSSPRTPFSPRSSTPASSRQLT